jgi:small subunit ribosomal protein S1
MNSDQETIGVEPVPAEEAERAAEEPMDTFPGVDADLLEGDIHEVEEAPTDEPGKVEELPPTSLEPAAEDAQEGAQSPSSHPMDALLDADSYELDMPKRGEIREGTIARVTETDILVDVGAKSEGVIPLRELERLSEEKREDLVVGAEVTVYVLRSGGRDGSMILSLGRAEEEKDWQTAESLRESRELFEGIVSGYNKGGLIIKLGQLRGFVPASQVSLSRRRRAQGNTPDQRWGKMVDEPIITKVIEVDRRRNRLILSERAATREARDALKERLISNLEPGEIREGHVISLADFGAFVDIGGADGLVHKSEITWKRIAHPRELLTVGQTVQVKVLGVDSERRRISLSMRDLESDPWDEIVERFVEGQLVEGSITKLTKFGAFASLAGTEEYDFEGLIHISELSDRRVEHPREVVQEGQDLTLRVIKIDRKRRRIGLSLKRVTSSEYADQDWQPDVQDIDALSEEGIGIRMADEVEDFDAALEAEAPELEEVAEGSEPMVDAMSDIDAFEADAEAPEGDDTEQELEPELVEEVSVDEEETDTPPEEIIEAEDPVAEASLSEEEFDAAKEAEAPELEVEGESPEPTVEAISDTDALEADAEAPEGEDTEQELEPELVEEVSVEEEETDTPPEEIIEAEEPTAEAPLSEDATLLEPDPDADDPGGGEDESE